MDAHDSDVCVNVVGKSLEAVRSLLRRTFCTLSRDAGVPDRDIMAAGGWNSPQMLDYYDMSRRGLNGKAGDGLQDYLGEED